MRIYVGNLPYAVTDEELRQHFEKFGQVQSVSIINDKQTGRSKGFGFVEMDSNTEAQEAITRLHDQEFQNRKLVVNEARPREPRSDFGGGRFFNKDRGSSSRRDRDTRRYRS